MRLFFALWPDDDARAHIARAALALRLAVDARPVPQENYHATLAFVGEVSMPQLAVLQQIAGALRVPRFTFTCDSIRRVRLLAGSASGSGRCEGIVDCVDAAVDAIASGSRAPAALLEARVPAATAAYAYHAREEGRASPCAASNVSIRLECTIIQSGTLRYQRRTLCLYSSRYLATTV